VSNENYSKVQVRKHLCDMFPIKNGIKEGEALMLLLFIFTFEYAIRWVQVNQDDLQLSGTHQLLVYADNVKILGGRIHTIRKYATALVSAS